MTQIHTKGAFTPGQTMYFSLLTGKAGRSGGTLLLTPETTHEGRLKRIISIACAYGYTHCMSAAQLRVYASAHIGLLTGGKSAHPYQLQELAGDAFSYLNGVLPDGYFIQRDETGYWLVDVRVFEATQALTGELCCN